MKAANDNGRLPAGVRPRGLCRVAAAEYIGVSPTLFDEMIADQRMPQPKMINTRRVWDALALDLAFESLPSRGSTNPWDTSYG